MAYRKTYSRSSKSSFRAGDYVPIWSKSNTDAVTGIFKEVLGNVGVTDLPSYFEKLFIPIVLCIVIGAVYGGHTGGFSGFIWYGLAGLAAPAAVVWLGIVVCYCAVILGVFFAAWAAILFSFFWLLGR